MPSPRKPKRTILTANFLEPRGLIEISDLMRGDPERWQHLRKEINRQRKKAPDRPLARCLLCQEPIYIRVQSLGSVSESKTPVFSHFPGNSKPCPWHDDTQVFPDDPRAAKYKGQQESAKHKWLCKTIANLLGADTRCGSVEVETYRRPTIEHRGRYPDVLAQLHGLGEIAIEVQLSKPFATEVAARQLHYERENVGLIWVFAELPEPLPQGFQDVITSQRGNAFIFDQSALEASVAANTLVLKAYMEAPDGSTFETRMVRIDDFQRGPGSAMFVDDRRSSRLLSQCKQIREQWWHAKLSEPEKSGWQLAESVVFEEPWEAILRLVPGLDGWSDEIHTTVGCKAQFIFTGLVLILFSLVHSAKKGEEINYKTEHKGTGMLTSMISSVLENGKFKPYAPLLSKFIALPAVGRLLRVETVERKLKSAMNCVNQVSERDPVWKAAAELFPEILNPIIRQELVELDSLPDWARDR